MMNPKGRWNDVSCNSQGYVICEKCINCPPDLLERSALDEGLSKLLLLKARNKDLWSWLQNWRCGAVE